MDPFVNNFNHRTIAQNFDEFLGPRLFIPWGELLLDKANLSPGDAVLDISTGPGALAPLIARRVGLSGRVVGTDIKPEIPVAARARVKYGQPPPFPLKVPKSTFDTVVFAHGLSSFSQPVAALQAIHNALKSGGQVAISIWCSSEANPYFYAIASSFRKVRASLNGGLKHQDHLQRYYKLDELRQLFAASGFREVSLSQETLPLVIEGGIPQALAGVAATAHQTAVANFSLAQRALFNQEMAISLNRYLADGQVVIPTSSYIAIARA